MSDCRTLVGDSLLPTEANAMHSIASAPTAASVAERSDVSKEADPTPPATAVPCSEESAAQLQLPESPPSSNATLPSASDRITTAARFIDALFDPNDTVCIRPVETWTEHGKKQARVAYKEVLHAPASRIDRFLGRLLSVSEAQYLNLFFGVCPRFRDRQRGPSDAFDQAWQIRTVRCLWIDVDGAVPDEVLQRIKDAGLPEPSIVVASGHGVHVYWLLDQPYLIDDVGDPPAVLREWIEQPNGTKKPRTYFVEEGERVYLDRRGATPRLSDKALHVQHVIAGVAKRVGGDHTQDLSRLLRIPGTLNRKDQRNGVEPVETELLVCEKCRRYSIALFEKFKAEAPQYQRAKQVAAVPLPITRKTSPSNSDKLDRLIVECDAAEPGARSEADFALCCFAIRKGVAKQEVWSRVQYVGKFAQRGEPYFELTWKNAEHEVRADRFAHAVKEQAKKRTRADGNQQPSSLTAGSALGDGYLEESSDDARGSGPQQCITVDDDTELHVTLTAISSTLTDDGKYFARSGQLVHIQGGEVTPILTSSALAGHLSALTEFNYTSTDSKGNAKSKYGPLRNELASCWLNNPVQQATLRPIKLFARNPVYSHDARLLPPGYDDETGIYYAGEAIEPSEGTEHLDRLLLEFCFRAPADRTNYIAMLLTSVLMPRFVGAKPACLLNGNQPGLGKTMLAQIAAILRDDATADSISFNPNDEEFEKRIGAAVRRGSTTLIIDNAKTTRRSPRIESACLERSITDEVLSFRLLGSSSEIRAENSHSIFITANSSAVSPDLLSRCVVVNLHYEGDPKRRTFEIADPEGFAKSHRAVLNAELLGMVERWKASGMPHAEAATRFNKRGWGSVVGGILEANKEPDFLANADEAAASLDETRREFAELISVLADSDQGIWRGSDLVDRAKRQGLLEEDLGNGSPHSQAIKMGVLAGRFLDEGFDLGGGKVAVLRRDEDRQGKVYRIELLGDD